MKKPRKKKAVIIGTIGKIGVVDSHKNVLSATLNLNPKKSKAVNYQKEVDQAKTVTRIAKEDIPCDACQWLKIKINPLLRSKLTAKEAQIVGLVEANNWKIKKGQAYTEEAGTWRGKPYQSRYFKSVHDICTKYGLYSSNAIN